ncbi:MAG: hypothetical protein O3A21_09090, partial [Proteobacteria bacterium]|nr:hypothetical protein [Pseudomonadota bacterium]
MQDKNASPRQAETRDKTLAQSVCCKDAAHLYLPGARDLIGRFLRTPFLDRRRITAIELLHSPQYQRALIDDRRIFQATVQNFCVAQVKGTDVSPPRRIKEMFSYVDDAARRMVMLEQSAPVGQLNRQDCIEQVLIALGQRPTTARDTWISRAITAYLVNCQNWTEKLQRLLLLFEAIAQQADAGPEGIAICDVFLGD